MKDHSTGEESGQISNRTLSALRSQNVLPQRASISERRKISDAKATEDGEHHCDGVRDTKWARVRAHDKTGEPYADYVVRLSANPVARQVKLADLEDNSRFDRTLLRPASVERDFRRIHRYQLSYQFLQGKFSEKEYREAMAAYG